MTQPLISFVIPVRDRPAALARALAAIDVEASRTRVAVETIVVDDVSETPVAAPSGGAAPVTLLRSARRLGANGARALGLSAATGAYVNFHDSDDCLEPGWIDAVARAIADNPTADLLMTRRVDVVAGNRCDSRQAYFEREHRRPRRIRRALAFRNCLGPFGGLVFARRSIDGDALRNVASSQDWVFYLLYYAATRPRVAALVPDARFLRCCDGLDRISRRPRAKMLGMFAVDRLAREVHPFGVVGRYYLLHYFSPHVWTLRRATLIRIHRRLWPQRIAASALFGLYAAVVLRWR